MARSVTIWLVTGSESEPLAAFTVKHELVTWLERWQMREDDCTVWKMADKPVEGYSLDPRRVSFVDLGIVA